MIKCYLVVDQNFLRKAELKNIVDTCPNARFVLPDAALIEMCKSPEWESTLRNSLNILSAYPNRTRIGLSIDEAINYEAKEHKSIKGHLLPKKFVPIITELLSALSTGASSQTLAMIAHKILFIQESLMSSKLNHLTNKQDLVKLIDEIKRRLTPEQVRLLRNKTMERADRLNLIIKLTPLALEGRLSEVNFPTGKRKAFLKNKPLTLRYAYIKIWAALDWITKGGLEEMRPERVTNEVMDHDYILLATFFDGILSEELRVNEAYEDLCELIRYPATNQERGVAIFAKACLGASQPQQAAN